MREVRFLSVLVCVLAVLSLVSCGSNPTPAPTVPAAPTAIPKPVATAAPAAKPAETPTAIPAKPAPTTPPAKPAAAAVTWKYMNYIGTDTTAGEVSEWMLSEIEKRSAGKMKFERYWNASLAPAADEPKMLKANLVQMALIGPGYTPAIFKLSRGFGVQYGATGIGASPDAFAYAVKKMVETYAPLTKEFTDAGVLFFADNTSPDNMVYAPKAYWKWEDFKGKRVRIYGAKAVIWKEWGASTLNIPFNEVYQALQTGVIDVGTAMRFTSQTGVKFYEIAPVTMDLGFGSDTFPEVISLRAWETLPQDLKQVFNSVAADFQKQKWAIEEKAARYQIDQLSKRVTFVKWSKAEREKGIAQGKGLELQDWLNEMEKESLPGKEFWSTFQSTMKEYMATQKVLAFDGMASLCKDGGQSKDGVFTPPPQ